jgi:hypothetical protein
VIIQKPRKTIFPGREKSQSVAFKCKHTWVMESCKILMEGVVIFQGIIFSNLSLHPFFKTPIPDGRITI